MREGRRRPSLGAPSPPVLVGVEHRNEGGAPAPLVGECGASTCQPLPTAMREGRRRPSLGRTADIILETECTAMREGRRRPSLRLQGSVLPSRSNHRNEGGAPAPLVGRELS